MADRMTIYSVTFGEDSVAITYGEQRDIGRHVQQTRTIIISHEHPDARRLINEASEAIEELVDAGSLSLRNPPTTFTRSE